ncbi:hypothetical protein F5J12DRAFT_796834 [Pisolithus orientalis]|uniref:uncharacterized protein n=1 Tax=Pisolithus orientalis TaxID=936130 RepID=UPI002224E636|nr:uncharacterized protein F5J12DRAFT_796834 [Pisolithus orientalis]KAI6032850.1 hypothetical protein F5J12DRAFT_796834 [Pisolithus orientalis]
MSGSVYRLETPRARPPPPPLRLLKASSVPSSNGNSQTLLYDLPSSVTSPPNSPKAKSDFTSPTSPTFSAGRSRGRRSGRPGPTPPPSARNRSSTPLGVSRSDLEQFAEYCRAWYFDQDEASGRQMTQVLTNLKPAQRAPYSRLQASVRSAYHASVNARRHAEFQAHLTATQPGGSLMPHSRANPTGPEAKKERFDRLDRFMRTWCTMGMPGTKPFFESLWAIMRLQVLPEDLGGAGPYRIRWEFDDAVFKEAAGKDFMLDAIDVLKGVLAFEDSPSANSRSGSGYQSPTGHAFLSQFLPLGTNTQVTPTTRTRAPSDPFLDMPALSHSASTQSSSTTAPHLPSGYEERASPVVLNEQVEEDGEVPIPLPPLRSELEMGESEVHMRTWTAPDLSNPEYLSLLTVFPSFITRRPLPRFPVSKNPRATDIEEGEDGRGEGKEIRFGTGTMWISSKRRSEGYRGHWWTRFVLWWRGLFC